MHIACVVVTFNRVKLLRRCLDAVAAQTRKPDAVYILDNASTDGTPIRVAEWGYADGAKDGIAWRLIRNARNEGGAGGFYVGMKTAMESGEYDGLWVMDDDGEPALDCLEKLSAHLGAYDYVSPMVVSDVDRVSLSFYGGNPTIPEFLKKVRSIHSSWLYMEEDRGLVHGFSCPFNGILYSAKLVRSVGYPKREMFIWGDENNYRIRCRKQGFTAVTAIGAIHYHPADRKGHLGTKGKFSIKRVDQPWKLLCYIRNAVYNFRVESGWLWGGYRGLQFTYLHLQGYRKHRLGRRGLILRSALHGYFGYFGGFKGF